MLVVKFKDVSEFGTNRYVTEESTIGIRPGQKLPKTVLLKSPDGESQSQLVLVSSAGGVATYTDEITVLKIFND